MKENSIKPYCYCGESESSLVDNAILFILVMNTEEYFWMKSYGWKHPAVIVYSVWRTVQR
ncbi:hypothetical protein ACIXN4_19525 [Bacteroides fragilis]